jgi:aspartate/methionine/tyrosine aminotransferase
VSSYPTSGSPLRAMLADTVPPNHLPDVAWLQQYLAAGAPAGEPVILSLGETWEHTPEPLLDALRGVPSSTHGYQISMYGLPLLRTVLKDYVADTQQLPRSPDWELAVSWTGTRSAMRDFAIHVASERARAGRAPGSVLAVAPAWDYAGFTEPLGFATAYIPFDPAAGSLSPQDIRRAAAALGPGELSMVVVNAQHNPTGANWSPDVVATMVEVALERGAAILVDDAYYGLCPPDEPVTSAMRILLGHLERHPTPVPWLGVRSLGKQFHCNGWALGAVTAAPALLDTLVNDIRPRHTFNYAVHLQWAMAQWLMQSAAVDDYLAKERVATASRRAAVLDRLPQDARRRTIAGPAAPYVLFPVPGQLKVGDYLRSAALDCGVVLSDAWPLARTGDTGEDRDTGYARLYLGPDLPVLMAAVDRLEAAGLWPGSGTSPADHRQGA